MANYKLEKRKRIKKLMEKLDSSGMESWTEGCQEKAKQTMVDFEDIFALEPLELGKINLVKHSIKVNNQYHSRNVTEEFHHTNSKK